MKKEKYIIKFVGNGKEGYIRKPKSDSDPYPAFLSKTTNKISSKCLYNTEDLARIAIVDFIEKANKELTLKEKKLTNLKKENVTARARTAKARADSLWTDITWDIRYTKLEIKRLKVVVDIDNYSVESFTPEFECDINKKTLKAKWKEDGTANKYCMACGGNLYHGQYLAVRTIRLCPFCLSKFGEDSKKVIEELKKEDPNIEDNYNIGVFVAHID